MQLLTLGLKLRELGSAFGFPLEMIKAWTGLANCVEQDNTITVKIGVNFIADNYLTGITFTVNDGTPFSPNSVIVDLPNKLLTYNVTFPLGQPIITDVVKCFYQENLVTSLTMVEDTYIDTNLVQLKAEVFRIEVDFQFNDETNSGTIIIDSLSGSNFRFRNTANTTNLEYNLFGSLEGIANNVIKPGQMQTLTIKSSGATPFALMSISIDGVVIDSTAFGQISNGTDTGDLFLGSNSSGTGRLFNGIIRELRRYDTYVGGNLIDEYLIDDNVLDLGEITNTVNATRHGQLHLGLSAYWTLGNGASFRSDPDNVLMLTHQLQAVNCLAGK